MGSIWIGEKDLHSTLRKIFSKNTHTHTHIVNKISNCHKKKSLTFIWRIFWSKRSQISIRMYDNFSPHFQHTTCHEDVGGNLDTFLCMIYNISCLVIFGLDLQCLWIAYEVPLSLIMLAWCMRLSVDKAGYTLVPTILFKRNPLKKLMSFIYIFSLFNYIINLINKVWMGESLIKWTTIGPC
jgi:hypothetical protein